MSLGRIFRSPVTPYVTIRRLGLNSLPTWTPSRCWFATNEDDPPFFSTEDPDRPSRGRAPSYQPSQNTTQFALYHAHTKPEYGCQFGLSSNNLAVYLTVRKQVGPKPVRGVKSTQKVFDTQKGTIKLSIVEASGLSLFFGGQQEVFNLFHKSNDGTTSTVKVHSLFTPQGQVKSRDGSKYWSLTVTSEKYGGTTMVGFDAAEARALELYLIEAVRASFTIRNPSQKAQDKGEEGDY